MKHGHKDLQWNIGDNTHILIIIIKAKGAKSVFQNTKKKKVQEEEKKNSTVLKVNSYRQKYL